MERWFILTGENFTHFNKQGRGRMVDVTGKDITHRLARAQAKIFMKKETLKKIKDGSMAKGDVLGVAQVAGILGAKHTPDLIPMCHPLLITGVDLEFKFVEEQNCLVVEAAVKVKGQTGVEMEALTAVSIAALTVYDMCKAVDKDMEIRQIRLLEKKGGKSGHFYRGDHTS
ncbi:MAG: cyclic pyranopterin monophosphate synthase MoaC [Dethiobacter sp.]|nr:MAG: cyclic pyranopterin monophosphate synthase MoaC [Dethiobacter sp.]